MNNFAVLDIAYYHTPTSITITITTNNPCHLTCYYTDKEPGSHRTSRNQRGLTLPWGVYYCFVAWLSVEQSEAGDTLIHTFEIPAWSYCQTKWLAFRGTVAEVLSPSVSCLFEHHHPGPGLQIAEQPKYDKEHAFGAYGTGGAGQRLFIHNASLTSFGFWIRRTVHWPDTIYYRIYRIDPPGTLFQVVMDNALFSPYELKLIETEVDPPIPIDFEVRLEVHHPRRYAGPRLIIGYWDADILPNQCFQAMSAGSWVQYFDRECAYRYEYYLA